MKNFVLFGLVAICTVAMSSESAMAVGGGKTSKKARLSFKNVEPVNGAGLAVYVRAPGAPIPRTLGALRKQLIYIAPGETRKTGRLKNGKYELYAVNVAATRGDENTPIDVNNIPGLLSSTTDVNGFERTFDLNSAGFRSTN